MKIKKNDNVMIISGKDRGKSGKVLEVFPKENKIRVEGINLRKKHTRPKRQGQKGQVILVPLPVSASAAMLICPSCNKPRRAGYKVFENKKSRVCKKCGSEI
jgi:large subunit ribosomal protein L24